MKKPATQAPRPQLPSAGGSYVLNRASGQRVPAPAPAPAAPAATEKGNAE